MAALVGVRRIVREGAPFRSRLVRSFGCMLVVAATTGAYAWLMGPLLRLVLRGGASGDGLAAQFERVGWWALPTVLVAIGALKGVAYLGQFYWLGLYGQEVTARLRTRFFSNVLAWSTVERSRWPTGEVQGRFTADLAAVEQAATYTVASWLRDSVQIVVLAGVAVAVSWKLSLVALVASALALLPASWLSRTLLKRTQESQVAAGRLAAQVSEGLGALPTVQVFGAQQAEMHRFARITASLESAASAAGWTRAATPGVMEVLASVAMAGTLGWAMATDAVSAEALVSFLTALVLLYQPAKDIGRLSAYAVAASVALGRLDPLLHSKPHPVAAIATVRQAISFDDVHFGWNPGQADTLRGATFGLQVGQVTALAGPSGAGKSSVLSVLLGLVEPARGQVCVDGRATTAEARRGLFSYVTQEPFLFAASVADNLRLALPRATQSELETACRQAQAHDFVMALPQGYQTMLGERGGSLSGGQRQRLCLARALLSPAPVLVLDEPTSQLDPHSEAEVLAALQTALVGRTVLVVTHRLESLPHVDAVVRLSEGSVVSCCTSP